MIDEIQKRVNIQLEDMSQDMRGEVKAIRISVPREHHVREVCSNFDRSQAQQAINRGEAWRWLAQGKYVLCGPKYEWFRKCFAHKRIAWQKAEEEVEELIKELARTRLAEFMCGFEYEGWASDRLIEIEDCCPAREYWFSLPLTRVLTNLRYEQYGEEEWIQRVVQHICNQTRRKRNMLSSQFNYIKDRIMYLCNDLDRGRPSNRHLWEYVQEWLPDYKSTSRFIIGREKQDEEYQTNDSVKFGSLAHTYPSYECEGAR